MTTNLKAFAPAGSPSFDLHFDDAPTIYVQGQPTRTDPAVRNLERGLGAASAFDPYVNASVPLAQRLADTVEEQTLHMVNADPKRTPTFTFFGNSDFFFQASNPTACGTPTLPTCVDPKFAWNHGDFQDEIANTWLGMVGPGVARNGVDSKTWTDHVDIRPTINALAGLSDSYEDDGRVITQVLGHGESGGEPATQLGDAYKQLNAPFGSFGLDTLVASTAAIQSTDELKYDSIETQIANLTAKRDVLAGTIRAALNDQAAGGDRINGDQAHDWTKRAQSLIDQAHALAAAS